MLCKFGTLKIGIERLSELNANGYFEVCKDFSFTHEGFNVPVSEIDHMLQTHSFPPTKFVADGEGRKLKVLPHSFLLHCNF